MSKALFDEMDTLFGIPAKEDPLFAEMDEEFGISAEVAEPSALPEIPKPDLQKRVAGMERSEPTIAPPVSEPVEPKEEPGFFERMGDAFVGAGKTIAAGRAKIAGIGAKLHKKGLHEELKRFNKTVAIIEDIPEEKRSPTQKALMRGKQRLSQEILSNVWDTGEFMKKMDKASETLKASIPEEQKTGEAESTNFVSGGGSIKQAAKNLVSDPLKYMGDLGVAAAANAPVMMEGMSPMGQPLMMLAETASFADEFTSFEKDLGVELDPEITLGASALYGVPSGFIEAYMAKVVGFGKKIPGVSKVIDKAAGKVAKGAMGKVLSELSGGMARALVEGGEESVQGLWSDFVKYRAVRMQAERWREAGENEKADKLIASAKEKASTFKDVKQNFIMGTLLGTVYGGPATIAQTVQGAKEGKDISEFRADLKKEGLTKEEIDLATKLEYPSTEKEAEERMAFDEKMVEEMGKAREQIKKDEAQEAQREFTPELQGALDELGLSEEDLQAAEGIVAQEGEEAGEAIPDEVEEKVEEVVPDEVIEEAVETQEEDVAPPDDVYETKEPVEKKEIKQKTYNFKSGPTKVNEDNMSGLPDNNTTKTYISNKINENSKNAFLSIDGDKFKSVNDVFGHREGDKVIGDIGAAIRTIFPETEVDFEGREGGEEYFIDLGSELTDESIKKAGELVDYIAENVKVGPKKEPFTVSIGLGKGVYTTEGGQRSLLSDHVLYRAKNQGGNTLAVDKGGEITYIKGKDVSTKTYVTEFLKKQLKGDINELVKSGEIDPEAAERFLRESLSSEAAETKERPVVSEVKGKVEEAADETTGDRRGRKVQKPKGDGKGTAEAGSEVSKEEGKPEAEDKPAVEKPKLAKTSPKPQGKPPVKEKAPKQTKPPVKPTKKPEAVKQAPDFAPLVRSMSEPFLQLADKEGTSGIIVDTADSVVDKGKKRKLTKEEWGYIQRKRGRLHVIINNNLDPTLFADALAHEIMGHYGAAKVLASNRGVRKRMDRLFKKADKKGLLDDLRTRYTEKELKDEWVAWGMTTHLHKTAANKSEERLARQIWNMVKKMLIDLGIPVGNVDLVLESMVEKMGVAQKVEAKAEPKFAKVPKIEGVTVAEREKNLAKFLEGSKVKDVVYHGTTKDFTVFDIEKIGELGTSEGQGFYFTPDPKRTESYVEREGVMGGIMPVYLSIKKPMDVNQKKVTRAQRRKILLELHRVNSDALSNFGDVEYEGVESVLRDALESVEEDTDVDFIGGLINGGIGTYEQIHGALKKVTGYDGVYSTAEDLGQTSDVWVAFSPNQIKSATGNIGKYSVEDDDIRFARAPKVEGVTVAEREKNLAKFLKGSKVKKVVYHGTRRAFTLFKEKLGADIGFHFGTAEQAEGRLKGTRGFLHIPGEGKATAEEERIMPVYISIKKPLRLSDPGVFSARDESFANQLMKKGIGIEASYSNKEVITAIKEAGYDGIVYENEGPDEAQGTSWIAFSPNQIKSATGNIGKFSVEEEDIRFARAPETLQKEIDKLKEAKATSAEIKTILDHFAKTYLPPEARAEFLVRTRRMETIPGFARAVKLMATLKEKYRKEAEAAIEKTERKEAESNLKKVYTDAKKHLREMRPEFRDPLTELMGSFDPVNRRDKTLSRLAKMREYVENNPENMIPEDKLKRLAILEKTKIKDLTTEDLNLLAASMQHLIALNKLKNTFIMRGKYRKAAKVTEEALTNLKKKKTPKIDKGQISTKELEKGSGLPKRFFTTLAWNPELITEILDKEDNGIFQKILYGGIDQGIDDVYRFQDEAEGFFAKELKGVDVSKMSTIFHPVKTTLDLSKRLSPSKIDYVHVTLKGGRQIELTKGERIAIFLHNLNSDNRKHLIEGGIKFPSHQARPSFKLDAEDVQKIADSMTSDEKKVANAIHQYYQDQKVKINKTSVALNGWEVATEDDYFPIRTSYLDRFRDELRQKKVPGEGGAFMKITLEGMGMLKERKHTSEALILEDAFVATAKSIKMASAYVGLASPLRDAKMLLHGGGEIVNKAVINTYGRNYITTLDNYLNDIEGNFTKTEDMDKVVDALSRNYSVAVLGINPWVWLKQPVSLPLAYTEISPKYTTTPGRNTKAEIIKYSPQMRRRIEGLISKDVGEVGEVGEAGRFWGAPSALSDKIMKPISQFDYMAISTIWEMAKKEAQATTDLTGDALMRHVAKRAEQVVRRTQPTFEMKDRSEIGRTKNWFVKLGTKFSSQRNKNYIIATRATERYNRSERAPKDKLKLIKDITILGVIAPLMIHAVNRLRDYAMGRIGWEEEKKETSKMMREFKEALKGWLITNVGNVYFVGNIFNSIMSKIDRGLDRGYDVMDPLTTGMNDIATAIAEVVIGIDQLAGKEKYKSGSSKGEFKFKRTISRGVERLVGLGSKLLAIPYWQLKSWGWKIPNRVYNNNWLFPQVYKKTGSEYREAYQELSKTDKRDFRRWRRDRRKRERSR